MPKKKNLRKILNLPKRALEAKLVLLPLKLKKAKNLINYRSKLENTWQMLWLLRSKSRKKSNLLRSNLLRLLNKLSKILKNKKNSPD